MTEWDPQLKAEALAALEARLHAKRGAKARIAKKLGISRSGVTEVLKGTKENDEILLACLEEDRRIKNLKEKNHKMLVAEFIKPAA